MAQSEPDSELQPGLLLGGKYRLEREIGRGAMGTVWSALHESLHQRVAIKVISQEHAHSEELRKRFDTEARAAAKLRSRFVVGVSDNGETGRGLPYIVMEYLDGECLEDRISRLGCISLAETARIARHISRALGRAHAHGIVHRDLKPANIFIARSEDETDKDDWTAKVLDFGIAKMDDFGDRSTTKTGTVLGTPLFMSPEQVRGASSVDARADLYSFGMVIYNMLTGTYAFEGQSFGDLLVSICTDPLPELRRAAPHLPPELDAWFQKSCAREPDQRFQSADEMIRALGDAIDEQVESAARMSMADVSMRFSQPLAATFAAEDTASTGTPQTASGTGTVTSPRTGLDSSGVAASAVTVNHPPPRSSRALLWAGLGAASLVGVISAFAFGGPDDSKEEARSGSHQPESAAPSTSAAVELSAPDTPSVDASEPDTDNKLPSAQHGEASNLATKLPAKPSPAVVDSSGKPVAKPARSPATKPAIKVQTAPTAKPTQTAKPVVQATPEPVKPTTNPPPAQPSRPQVPDLGF